MHAALVSFLILLLSVTSARLAVAQPLQFARTDHASARGARAIVSADFNRDGWPDIAQAGLDSTSVSVLLNDHGGGVSRTLTSPVGLGPFAMATGDFNRDGIPDLAVANADGDSISILTGLGDGRFTRADIATGAQRSPRGIATGDFNGDGKLDLVYTAYDSAAVVVLTGAGTGTFPGRTVFASAPHPQGVTTADFDHDGQSDIAVACNAAEGLVVWHGHDGAFARVVVPGESFLNVLAAADLNADGWLDVAAASTDRGRLAIYSGGLSGLTHARTQAVDADPRGVTIADVNIDGMPDVITASRNTSTVNVMPGDPIHPGLFGPRLTIAAGLGARAVAVADFDGNGQPDLATGNQLAAAVTVLLNTTPFLRAAYTFGEATRPAGTTLASKGFANQARSLWGEDFNHDGRLDIVQRVDGSDAVAVVLTGGATVVLPGPVGYVGHLVADVDADGNGDVVTYASDPAFGMTLLTYLGDGHGAFAVSPITAASRFYPEQCVAGDMDRNGRVDLVCNAFDARGPTQPTVLAVLPGNGNGTFRIGTLVTDGHVPQQLADIDRDGALDVITPGAVWYGDGAGGLPRTTAWDNSHSQVAVADLNHDAYPDVVSVDSETISVLLGSAAGLEQQPVAFYGGLVSGTDFALADITADGRIDLVVNYLNEDADTAGVARMFAGRGDGTFGPADTFALTAGDILLADVTRDGLVDVVVARDRAIHVLVNQHNETNHPPVITAQDLAIDHLGCITLPVTASDPDQHALVVTWEGDVHSSGLMGRLTTATTCIDAPGTYRYVLTVSDSRGAMVTRTITVTVTGPLEIVLHMTPGAALGTGEWILVDDASAAGGVRAYNLNAGAPKRSKPLVQPAGFIEMEFLADPTQVYKLWLRLKADNDNYANDSVWVQFSGSTTVAGAPAYRIGTTNGLAVNLEECLNCGEAGWGWEDDGWGAVNVNGVTLRFPAGGIQRVRIQTREDGVSVDQIVLSAKAYLTMRPGAAKNDGTILPTTSW